MLDQKREEWALFQAFLETCPRFAGAEIGEWSLAEFDPPDVICLTASGRRIGVEICQWAHPEEMKAGKVREKIEQRLLAAVGTPQPINTSKNFWLAVFFPRPRAHIAPSEYPAYRKSLFQLIEHVDQTWPTKRHGSDHRFRELHRFPPLDKYLQLITFAPGDAMTPGADWIVPVNHVDSFDSRTMVDPLLVQLRKKAHRCRALKTPCDEVHLVVAYDQALGYCSPIATPQRRISEIAKEASVAFAAISHPFTGALLFIAIEPGRKVYRIL
jgi:hypothetical protein